ncbi:MAG: hypothetical protein U5R48_15000 [Gammaproteobacteria bacterium]|nr:hypothetical protein [Gammaproteobacteria bacterium]
MKEGDPFSAAAGHPDDTGRLARLESLLAGIYGPEQGGALCRSLAGIATEARRQAATVPVNPAPGPDRWSERDAVLITYADSLRHGDEVPLATLRRFLAEHLGGLVSTIHVLPFYPWSSDERFAVVDFRAVEPGVGDWSDIRGLAADFSLMADLVIDRRLPESLWFIDFVSDRAPGRDFFRVVDPETDLSRVVRVRAIRRCSSRAHLIGACVMSGPPSARIRIDLDFSRPQVLEEMVRVLCFYLANGVRVVRLDAIAYLWKEIGTRCIHHPCTHDIVRILRLVTELACEPHEDPVVLITETNVPHRENIQLFRRWRRGPSGLPVPAPATRPARPGDLRQRSADAVGGLAGAASGGLHLSQLHRLPRRHRPASGRGAAVRGGDRGPGGAGARFRRLRLHAGPGGRHGSTL